VLRTVAALTRKAAPTRFHVRAGFLSEVERTFAESQADLMISVLPPLREVLESVPLPEVPAILVAHRSHALGKAKKPSTIEGLRAHALLTVRGSDPRLNMSTAVIEPDSTIELNDFHSKKLALVNGLGFGWMPKYLIESELRRGILVPVKWKGTSAHRFRPFLYYRGEKRLGKAGRLFIETLRQESAE
jgi:DNA-binding transcriptional LysR family regulator